MADGPHSCKTRECTMTTVDGSPLGKATDYPDRYDASLLFAVPRAPQRAALGIEGNLPFFGCDVWNAYEITWRGRIQAPQALSRLVFPGASRIRQGASRTHRGRFEPRVRR